MVYKGNNFDPNYHLKKNFDRSVRETNYNSNYHDNNYHDKYYYNESYNSSPLPPSRRSNRSSSTHAFPIDDDRSRSARSSSRPRPEDSVDRRPERSLSRTYDSAPHPPSRRFDKFTPPRHYDDKRDSDHYTPSSSSSSSSSHKRDRDRREGNDDPGKENAGSNSSNNNNNNNKKREASLEKKSRVEDHLPRNPHDKKAHADAYRINGDNICKAPEDSERSRTPALIPRDSCMDDTIKGEADLQLQKSSPLSTQSATSHQDYQDWNTTENDHHYQSNNVNHTNNHRHDPNPQTRQSSVGTTTSSTTAADHQNPWSRSPSLLSTSSQLQSPASSTTDIHPGPTSNSTLTQPFNWKGQGEPGVEATTECLPSERAQSPQQSETIQPAQSQPRAQLGNITAMVPSLALQAVDEKINYLDRLWRSGSDKFNQTVKIAEQSVLTCVLRQVLEEVRIYAVLRESLQSQDFSGQTVSIEALKETMRQLDSRRKFDITCLQPGIPIPEVPFDQTLQAVDTMSPLVTDNGAETIELSAIQEPPIKEPETEMLSYDQIYSADAGIPRKRTLEQTDPGERQVNRVTKYHDDDIAAGDTKARQSPLDTSSTAEPQVASIPSLSSSLHVSSSSTSSTPTTKASEWDKLEPNKSSGTTQLDSNHTDLLAQQSNTISPSEAYPTSAVANTEQVISIRGGSSGISGRAIMDIEKELRLIREEGQEQRLRTDQLLAQLESEARLRREADHRVSQLTQELQNERHLTLEKDLESKRSEALLMMAKAREEIQQGKVLIAQAKEELALERAAKAEAMIETARIEVERNRLLAYIQSLGASPPTATAEGVFVGGGKPVLPSDAMTVSARFLSPAGLDGGILTAGPGSGRAPSPLTCTGNLVGQVNRDRSIESFPITKAAATPVKVESSS